MSDKSTAQVSENKVTIKSEEDVNMNLDGMDVVKGEDEDQSKSVAFKWVTTYDPATDALTTLRVETGRCFPIVK